MYKSSKKGQMEPDSQDGRDTDMYHQKWKLEE